MKQKRNETLYNKIDIADSDTKNFRICYLPAYGTTML